MEGQVTAVLQLGQGSLEGLPTLPPPMHKQQSQELRNSLGQPMSKRLLYASEVKHQQR